MKYGLNNIGSNNPCIQRPEMHQSHVQPLLYPTVLNLIIFGLIKPVASSHDVKYGFKHLGFNDPWIQ